MSNVSIIRNFGKPFKTVLFPEREGEQLEVTLRRPDMRKLCYLGAFPAPLLSKVGEMMQNWIGQDLSQLEDMKQHDGPDALVVLNILTCAASIVPRIVLTQAEVTDEDTFLIDDVEVDVRERIVFQALNRDPLRVERVAEQELAARFSENGHGDVPASDVPHLQAETESSSSN